MNEEQYLRDAIDNLNDCPIASVEIPEWNNLVVFVRTLTVADQIEVEKLGQVNDTAGIVAFVLCDSVGNRLYKDGEHLKKRNPMALKRILDKALELNNMGVVAVEDTKKN